MLATNMIGEAIELNAAKETSAWSSEATPSDAEAKARVRALFDGMSPGWKALFKRAQARDLGREAK